MFIVQKKNKLYIFIQHHVSQKCCFENKRILQPCYIVTIVSIQFHFLIFCILIHDRKKQILSQKQ